MPTMLSTMANGQRDLNHSRQSPPSHAFDSHVIHIARANGYHPQDEPHKAASNPKNFGLPCGTFRTDDLAPEPKADTSGAWAVCAEEVWRLEEGTVKDWKEEIDTMLVFAGLFSAIVATFNSQYYLNLQPMLQTAAPYTYINMSATTSIQSGGSSNFVGAIAVPGSEVNGTMISVNILWFCSLVLSLAAASIGISVKQWLKQYIVPQSVVPRQRAQIWHYRRRGLLYWRVPDVITLIPLLLQISLVLFLVGLQILLWTLSKVVGAVVLVPTALLLSFTAYTAFAPTLASDCPYRSPQAWWIYQALRRSTQLFALVSKFGFLTGWKLFLFSGRSLRPWSDWIDREKAKLRHPRKDESALDVLVAADRFVGGDSFLNQVVKPCLDHADIHSALPIFYQILQERAHLIERTPGQRPMPKWLTDEMDNGAVAIMGLLTLEMLRRVGDECDEADRLREEPRIIDLLKRLLSAAPAADTTVYERLVTWFVGADPSPEIRKEAVTLIWYNAPKFLVGQPELCVYLGNMCLNTVEQLQTSGNNPGRQRGALQALDHILFMTPAAHPSVYDCLCSLVKPAGNREAQADMDELVDLVFRHSDRFSSNDETNIQTLSSCLGILKEEDSPFTMVPLVSAIITMSARLPSPNVDIIEKALFAATGNVDSETVSSIAQKMDRADAWWITCRLVDSCISVAKRDITLLPSGTLGALEALASHCDAMASPSNTIALLAIRERLRILQDIAEGRPLTGDRIMDVEVLVYRPWTAHSRAARQLRRSDTIESHSLAAIQ